MKYAIIPYIALGLVLSLAIGIEYNCEGEELFPTYYGSPFVFKQKSLGSSMEFYFNIIGLLANVSIWSLLLFFVDKAIQTILDKIKKPKTIRILYKIIITFMIAFTTLNIWVDYIMLGSGFKKELNYWYWDMEQDAKAYGMNCEGKPITFKK